MTARLPNLLILMAMTIALGALRIGPSIPHAAHGAGEHAHQHEHTHQHGGHSHTHHHQHSDSDDEDSEDHHSDLDQLPDAPKIHWSGPRRIELDAPPPLLRLPSAAIASSFTQWAPMQRAKPPPRSIARIQHLNPIRTVILRL